MTRPLFSIVVPTRNRVETAKKAITSVLEQGFADYELIVSDNSTEPDNKLDHWLSQRTDTPSLITYVRTDGQLEMDANWEQASKRARGKYLLILPDRWVMRGGTLKLLASLVEREAPECMFWDTKLSINEDGCYRGIIESTAPVQYQVLRSTEVLEQLLRFSGYADSTVFTQPFPRSLNSIIRTDLVNDIRSKAGVFYAPHSCDYTSGISTLLNSDQVIHLNESLYLAIGTESNGQQASVHGIPTHLAANWRGLAFDSVLLTVLNDLEATFKRNGVTHWGERINVRNVLLSLLNEIHFKEWHGSALQTNAMRKQLFGHARDNSGELGNDALQALLAYDKIHAPKLRGVRRLLQRMNVFYKLYELKHAVLGKKAPASSLVYSVDVLSARRIQLAKTVSSYASE